MKSFIRICVSFGVLLVMPNLLYAQEDGKNCKDHPLLSRMPDFYISSCQESDYDSHVFYDEKRNKYVIEGRKCMIYYKIKKGFKPAGVLKIRKNYINAINKIGGTVLKEGGYTYMKVVVDGKEIWIELKLSTTTTGDNYTLTVVEKTVMEQEVVADPKAMAEDISSTGHVAVYGIYFDHDSYQIKAESDQSLNAIAAMLKANGSLSVYIVGHTDMTGELEYNMNLSHNRAKAVADTLVKQHGIAADRLDAKGVGPLCPVSTNRTEEGKKLNRRVDLVEMKGSGKGQIKMKSAGVKEVANKPSGAFIALLEDAKVSWEEGMNIEAVDKLREAVLLVWDDVPLTVRNVRLVSDPDNYVMKNNNLYGKGEPIYITSQIYGHQLKKVSDSYHINITTDFLVMDDSGKVLGGQQNVFTFDHISPIPIIDFTFDFTYTLTDAPEGTYDIKTTVHDKNSGKSTEFTTEVKLN